MKKRARKYYREYTFSDGTKVYKRIPDEPPVLKDNPTDVECSLHDIRKADFYETWYNINQYHQAKGPQKQKMAKADLMARLQERIDALGSTVATPRDVANALFQDAQVHEMVKPRLKKLPSDPTVKQVEDSVYKYLFDLLSHGNLTI